MEISVFDMGKIIQSPIIIIENTRRTNYSVMHEEEAILITKVTY